MFRVAPRWFRGHTIEEVEVLFSARRIWMIPVVPMNSYPFLTSWLFVLYPGVRLAQPPADSPDEQVEPQVGAKEVEMKVKGKAGEWSKVEVSDLKAPEEAEKLAINFRFVTGAVKGGHGEAFIDGVKLRPN